MDMDACRTRKTERRVKELQNAYKQNFQYNENTPKQPWTALPFERFSAFKPVHVSYSSSTMER